MVRPPPQNMQVHGRILSNRIPILSIKVMNDFSIKMKEDKGLINADINM